MCVKNHRKLKIEIEQSTENIKKKNHGSTMEGRTIMFFVVRNCAGKKQIVNLYGTNNSHKQATCIDDKFDINANTVSSNRILTLRLTAYFSSIILQNVIRKIIFAINSYGLLNQIVTAFVIKRKKNTSVSLTTLQALGASVLELNSR